VTARARASVQILSGEIHAALSDAKRGERLREGLVIAIAGPPNAGKSTLLNRLARRDVAIVSPHAGTTRDVIEVHLDLGGYPVTLLDTAGIRVTDDPVEREGVARATARAAAADLVLWLDPDGEAMSPAAGADPKADAALAGPATWLVVSKSDLNASNLRGADASGVAFAVSAATGSGMERLLGALTDFAKETFGAREPALVTRERQRRLLEDCAAALARAQEAAGEEILAEELRAAADALGRLTGRVDVEDILDVIFRDFCIGK
jgi:tRNA modification GTPase